MTIQVRLLPTAKLQEPAFWAALVAFDTSEAMASRILGIEEGEIKAYRQELFSDYVIRELSAEEEEQCREQARNYGLIEGTQDFEQVVRSLRFRRSMPPNWALDIPFPFGHNWRMTFDPLGIFHSLRSPDELESSDGLPLAEHDKDHLGPAAALRWAEAQALQAIVPDDFRDAALLLWSPIIGVSPKDNFDDIEAAIRIAVANLNIGVDRESLIRYFTYLEYEQLESAERSAFLKSIDFPLKGSEPYTDPHRLLLEWRLGPGLGWVNDASHSYRNPDAEGEEWLECQDFERFAKFLEMNGVSGI